MKYVTRVGIAALLGLALSACAHKDLTAPCGFDGGGLFGWLSASAFACGEMRPVNSEGNDGGR